MALRTVQLKCPSICSKLNSFKYFIRKKVTWTTSEYKLFRLDSGPPKTAELTKDDAIKIYTDMQSIRRMETNIGNLYTKKIIRGFCHLYNGEEAIAVGICNQMQPNDNVISSYRVHGWCYLLSNRKAMPVFSELCGRKNGFSKGKGGSMHMFTKNFYGGQGIVGAQVPLGTGLAFKSKYLKTNGATYVLYGDGASNQGQVFEAYNMAKLWNLPVVFICENNGYGMGTSAARSSANVEYYTRGDYIPGIQVDGMDVISVREASRFASDYCRKNGPILIEFKTYRYFGHSMSDPGTSYRDRSEVQNVRNTRDPINTFKERIIENNLATAEELKLIDKEINKKIENALKIALADQEIPMEDMTADICKKYIGDDIRGVTPYSLYKHINKPPPP